MPIYAYKCSACGHAKDALQKVSDAPLTTCPACGGETFSKQLTAAGFQLKGSGWYVTDFRDGGGAKPAPDKAADAKPADASGEKAGDKGADKSESRTESKSDAKPAETTATPAAAKSDTPAASAGGSAGR